MTAIVIEEGPTTDTTSSGTDLVIDLAAAASSGEAVVLSIFCRGASLTNPTEQTFTTITSIVNATEDDETRIIFWTSDGTATTQFTWTWTGSDKAAGCFWVLSGPTSWAETGTEQTQSRTTSATSCQPGSVTPALSDNIMFIITGIRSQNSEATSPSTDLGYTTTSANSGAGSNNAQILAGHLIQTAQTARNPTTSWTNSFTIIGLHCSLGDTTTAGGATNPKGPLGMPFYGPFGGPVSV